MKLRAAVVSGSLILFSLSPVYAQSTLVDWSQVWNYMHPTGGVLPAGSGATTPHPAGTTPWFATQATFAASYSGPSFSTGGAGFEAGSGAGPLGYGANDYMGNPLPPPAEFTALGTALTTPASGLRYTGYFRTTFTVPNDGNIYGDPVIRYIFDDGGYIYLDGVLVLSVNMGAGADDYLTLAANTANTESHLREGRLNLAPGSLTGGNTAVAPAIAGNAIVEQQITSLSPGVHTLAVALHNQANGSSDLMLAIQVRAGQADCLLDATASNVTRDPNGTPNDPNDDTVGATINVVPTGTVSASWQVSGPAGSSALGQGGAYNSQVQISNIPIAEFAGGGSFLEISDTANPDCSTFVDLSPPRIIATDDRAGGNVPITTIGTISNTSWVFDDSARTIFMNNGGGGARQIVTSVPVDLSGSQAVLFTGVLQVDDTSSGNEADDSFVAYLIIDGDTLNPINLITAHDTQVVDGILSDNELAPGPGSFVREFSHVIPAAANSVQIVIEGINNSGSENFTVRNLRLSTDTDGDGMDDNYEDANGLDKTVDDSGLDPDGDGLSNLEEFKCGTDPQNADTDGDGLSDGEEKNNLGTNPLSDDTDGDGLTDDVETNTGIWVSASDTGTDPNNADTDSDGLLDGVETNTRIFVDANDTGTDPNNPDTDGDLTNDGTEVSRPGRDPNVPDAQPIDFATDLVAYWPFEGDLLNLAFDDYHGTEDGGAIPFDPGMFGDAVHLDGSQSIVIGGDPEAFVFAGESLTVSAWFTADVIDTSWQALIAKGEGNSWRMHRRGGDTPPEMAWTGGNGDTPRNNVAIAIGTNPETWHHVVGVTDSSTQIEIIYLDGAEIARRTGATLVRNSGNPMRIGENPDALNRRWKGKIDDTAIWNRALEAAEIEALYNAGLAGESLGDILFGTALDPLGLAIRLVGGQLELSWDSADGQLFNVRSETSLSTEPLTWAIFDGHQDIVATPPRNVLTIPLPADPKRFFVVESFPAPPESIFFDDLESGAGGWTLGSDGAAGTVWELGSPGNFGPATAHSPVNCYATNLTSDYAFDADIWLRSPAIDLTTAGAATVSYFEFKDIEEQFDFGTVSILDAADNSVLAVLEDAADGVTVDWTQVFHAIPAAGLGKLIKIEFRFNSDNIQNFPGWYLDDILVTVP